MAAELPYQKPSEALAKLVDQPKLPGARVSPDYRWACFLSQNSVESIRDLAGPELKLAGIRFNPQRYAPSRSSWTYDSITWHDLESGEETLIEGLPAGEPPSAGAGHCFELSLADGRSLAHGRQGPRAPRGARSWAPWGLAQGP